jgi:hypothetical protein
MLHIVSCDSNRDMLDSERIKNQLCMKILNNVRVTLNLNFQKYKKCEYYQNFVSLNIKIRNYNLPKFWRLNNLSNNNIHLIKKYLYKTNMNVVMELSR